MLDAGVDLRDVRIADRKNLGRHPNCILAACMASDT